MSQWKPTHRHYKGAEYELLYMGLWTGNDENNGRDCMIYKAANGMVCVMFEDQWREPVERYQMIKD